MTSPWPDESGQPPAIAAEIREKVAVVTLNRPSRLNAWTPAMGTLYFDTLDRLSVDTAVNVILVHGAGRAFCAGADMTGLQNVVAGGGTVRERDPRRYWHPLTVGKPIVAAIHGPCYGVGVQQALCCDLRFAARDARISVPYAKRGLIAEVGISWLLSRIVGASRAMDLLMSGRVLEPGEALQMGLINQLFEPDELLQRAFEYCAAMAAQSSPWSMRMMKQQVYHDLMTALPPAFALSEALLTEALAGADFAEGVTSFREKRTPVFPPLAANLARLDPWPGA